MAKNITTVKWEATGLPANLVINEDTGVISGIPNVQPPATFTPSVTVTTNYGTDTKIITINVAVPDDWKPVIDAGQVVNVVADLQMTPYTVTGQNVIKTE